MDIQVERYASCAEKVHVNQTNMMQFIRSLNDTFSTFYSFYDIARDPLDSFPLSYEPELGYSIYNSSDTGKVDLAMEMDLLYEQVKRNGSSLATFWEIARVYDRLLDGHVVLMAPFGAPADVVGPTGLSEVYYLSHRIEDGPFKELQLDFYYDGTAEVLQVSWFDDGEAPALVQRVSTLNGKLPLQFFEDFVSIPGTTNNAYSYKALGARVNGLFDLAMGRRESSFLSRTFYGNPSWFPPKIDVQFEDGSKDEWTAWVLNGNVFNVTDIETAINTPGRMYQSLQSAIGKAVEPVLTSNEVSFRTASTRVPNSSDGKMDGVLFHVVNGTEQAEYLGVTLFKDFVVLKISDFLGVPLETMWNSWNKAVELASSAGVKQLLLDLTGNGGGFIKTANALMACMHPSSTYSEIAWPFDSVLPEVVHYTNDTLLPFYQEIIDLMNEGDNLQVLLESMNNASFDRIISVAEAIEILLDDLDTGVVQAAYSLMENQTVDDLAGFFTALSDILSFNAISAAQIQQFLQTPSVSVVRGGQNVTLSGMLPFLTLEEFQATRQQCNEGGFQKYVVVEGGNGGSSACMTTTFLQQASAHNLEGIPAVAVSYGGTGDAETTPLAQYCGGAVVQPNLEHAYVPLAVLYLWKELLEQTDLGNIVTKTQNVFDEYDALLPDIPYFQNDPVRMPTSSVYSKFMFPGAAPLEYINFPAQGYIKQWYYGLGFEPYNESTPSIRYGPDKLRDLYSEAAQFFVG